MAKPSIFSRDYEKKMKKRRKIITLTIVLIVVIVGALVFQFKIKNMDFTNVKAKIQAWVDSGKEPDNEDEIVEEEQVEDNKKDDTKEDVKPKEEEKTMEINISEGIVGKINYKEVETKKEITTVEMPEGITYDINANKNKILVLDNNQNMKIFDLDGTVLDITRTQYVSGKGTVFTKENVLASNTNYIWHSQCKFIDDKIVLYVSQLPYFGTSATNKYIWVKNIETGEENAIWNPKGSEILVGEITQEKGIQVTIDGVNYFVNGNGEVVQ